MKKLMFILLFLPVLGFAQNGLIPLRQIAPIDTSNIVTAEWEAYIDRLTTSSPWNTDANGINYQAGNIGIGTTSLSSTMVFIDAGDDDGLQVWGGGTTFLGDAFSVADGDGNFDLFDIRGDGEIYAYRIDNATTTNTLYYNTSTKEVTYGTAPSGGTGAPTDATYLTTTSNATLTNEVVVGTTPSGDLGGTWSNISVDNDSHTHDLRYYTETELGSTTSGSSGANKIGTFDEFGNSASTNVQDVLDDLDAAITSGNLGTSVNQDVLYNNSGTVGGFGQWDSNGLSFSGTLALLGAGHYLDIQDAYIILRDVTSAPGTVPTNSGVIYVDGASDIPYFKNNTDTYTFDLTSTSDFFKKKDFKLIDSPLNKILSLKSYQFNWRNNWPEKAPTDKIKVELQNDTNKRDATGMIAQEVEKIIPEVVGTFESGYKNIDYDALVPYLVEAIKEQQKQIEQLIQEVEKTKMNVTDVTYSPDDGGFYFHGFFVLIVIFVVIKIIKSERIKFEIKTAIEWLILVTAIIREKIKDKLM